MELVIKGAQLADGTKRDIYVSGDRFVAEKPSGAKEISADGLIALPGLVDLHTHLREPGGEEAETIETGTAAAAAGGYTAVFAMANTSPVTDNVERVEDMRRRAKNASAQVEVIASITKGLEGKELNDIDALAAAGVKVLSDDGKCVMDASLMRRALEAAAKHNLLVAQHSQDHNLATAKSCADEASIAEELGLPGWPWPAESSIIARDAMLSELTGACVHACHISTAQSLAVVRWAKARGVRMSAEATPHHLLLTSEKLRGLDTSFKVNPPLRGEDDVMSIRQGLADGIIDIVGTDHAPHTVADKSHSFPDAKPGMIALEQSLAVVIETLVNPGLIGWEKVADILSYRPAQLGRISNQGRPVEPGQPANLTLIDPTRRAVVDREKSASKGRNNPYHGLDLPDPIELTLCLGQITYSHSA